MDKKLYAVIFRAHLVNVDEEYTAQARALRDRALSEFGCLEFTSACQGTQEIAISYWSSLEDIKRWKADSAHRAAQKNWSRWYASYQVEVVETLRSYGS